MSFIANPARPGLSAAIAEYDEDVDALVYIEAQARALAEKARAWAKTAAHHDAVCALDDLAGLIEDALGDTTSPAVTALSIAAAKLEDAA